MKCKVRIIAFIFLMSLSMVSCNDSSTSQSLRMNPADPLPVKSGVFFGSSETISDNKKIDQNIDLLYDTSGSMKGYLYPNSSRYSKVVDGIATTAKTLVNYSENEGKFKVNYYQFGDKFAKLSNPDNLSDPDSCIYDTSHIELAIEHTNLDNLTVIVTDLQIPSDSLDVLINKIGSDYISKGYAIGIVGVKSEYSGYVYSLEQENDKIVVLADGKKAEDTFPFYMLILGKQSNIINFYENLSYFSLSDFPQGTCNFSLIPLASKGIISSVDDKNIELKGLNEQSKIFVETTQFVNDTKTKQYKLSRVPKGEVGFNLSGVNCNRIKYIPDTVSQLSNIVDLYYYDQSQSKWVIDPNKDKIISIKDKSTNASLNLDYIVASENMTANTTYAIHTRTGFKQGSEEDKSIFTLPDWVTQWTTDKSRIAVWKAEYEKFRQAYGDPVPSKVAGKYRDWLKKNKIQSVVDFNTTKDLDKLFKKTCYYVEKGEDLELYNHVFYITKQK